MVGGFCGLAGFIINLNMIDALNGLRPSDNQIPSMITSWADYQWWLNRGREDIRSHFLPYWSIRKEFRGQFPASRLYFWSTFTFIGMYTFIAIGVILFARAM
jgi:hypothetical protein